MILLSVQFYLLVMLSGHGHWKWTRTCHLEKGNRVYSWRYGRAILFWFLCSFLVPGYKRLTLYSSIIAYTVLLRYYFMSKQVWKCLLVAQFGDLVKFSGTPTRATYDHPKILKHLYFSHFFQLFYLFENISQGGSRRINNCLEFVLFLLIIQWLNILPLSDVW